MILILTREITAATPSVIHQNINHVNQGDLDIAAAIMRSLSLMLNVRLNKDRIIAQPGCNRRIP